jgi:hypothetical protein
MMRSELTFRVVGISADGLRHVVGERFWRFQAEIVSRRLVQGGKFREIFVEPDVLETFEVDGRSVGSEVPAYLAPTRPVWQPCLGLL